MTDDRPRPKYGEYAPIPPGAASPVAPPPVAPPAPPELTADEQLAAQALRIRRSRDVLATTLLLLYAVFDVATSLGGYAALGATLKSVFDSQNITGFSAYAQANELGIALNYVRIGLLVVTIIVSLVLIRMHKRAFWVPLAGFVLATLVTSTSVVVLLLQDPGLVAYFQK